MFVILTAIVIIILQRPWKNKNEINIKENLRVEEKLSRERGNQYQGWEKEKEDIKKEIRKFYSLSP